MRPFIECSRAEFREMMAQGKTWADVRGLFYPPAWCAMHEPLNELGCWSLIGQKIKCRDDCDGCPYLRTEKAKMKKHGRFDPPASCEVRPNGSASAHE